MIGNAITPMRRSMVHLDAHKISAVFMTYLNTLFCWRMLKQDTSITITNW